MPTSSTPAFRGAGALVACVASAVALLALLSQSSLASTISFSGTSSDGHPVSGAADFTLDDAGDTVTVKLSNTTTTTLDAGELLTGIDFTIGSGLAATLTSATAIQRTVDGAGGFVDTGSSVPISWSRTMVGMSVHLDFTPNSKDAIIGAPIAGSYSGANSSIRGNPGHNPFAALTGTFVFSVPGLGPADSVAVSTWRFGTTLDPATAGIPEPAAAALASMALLAAGLRGGRD